MNIALMDGKSLINRLDRYYIHITTILFVILISMLLASVLLHDNLPDNLGTFAEPNEIGGEELQDICVDHDSVAIHYHFTLILSQDNINVIIPGSLGRIENCYRPIHAHDTSGYLHVEIPDFYQGHLPTLYDVFLVWGVDVSHDSLNHTKGIFWTYINGEYTGTDFLWYRMDDGDVIKIEFTSLNTSVLSTWKIPEYSV